MDLFKTKTVKANSFPFLSTDLASQSDLCFNLGLLEQVGGLCLLLCYAYKTLVYDLYAILPSKDPEPFKIREQMRRRIVKRTRQL